MPEMLVQMPSPRYSRAFPQSRSRSRKKTFSIAFLGVAIPMLCLAFSGTRVPAEQVLVLKSISVAIMAIVQCGVYVYAPEVYPTRIRASGAGAASAITPVCQTWQVAVPSVRILAPPFLSGMRQRSSALSCVADLNAETLESRGADETDVRCGRSRRPPGCTCLCGR